MAAPTNDLQYYLYLEEDWKGPYPVVQIKTMLRQKHITDQTYAYEPQHQSQLTVADLLAGRAGVVTATDQPSSGGRDAVSGRSAEYAELDLAVNALAELRRITMEAKPGGDRELEIDKAKESYRMVRKALQALHQSPAELRNFAIQIDKTASDVATKHADRPLTASLVDLRDCISHADPDEIVPAADAALAQILHLAQNAGQEDPFEIFDDDKTPPGTGALDVVESARFEMSGLQADLSTVKEAYGKLQETFAKEQKQAHRLMLQLKEQFESEQKSHEGDIAELRALAAEIHDLATSFAGTDIDPALAAHISRLAEELQNTIPTQIVPVAEAVLHGMVRRLGNDHGQARAHIEELSAVRAELLQLKSEMSILKQREEQLLADKSRLQKHLEEERGAATKVDQSARAREAQLKSTISALQITKQLHQEVMEDLQEQLGGAQKRVEDMEREMLQARSELKGTRSTYEQREQELMGSLTTLSEERKALEDRQAQLSGGLEAAERELAEARAQGEGNEEDDSLAEALAAKVNQLRISFDQTRARLKEQETSAGKLQLELEAARTEAGELRTRSDQLAGELDGAKGNLEQARKRMDELQRAAARLEAERGALLTELNERRGTDGTDKGTDAFSKGTDTITKAEASHLNAVVAKLEAQVAETATRAQNLEQALAGETDHVADLTAERNRTSERADGLTAEVERLRGELQVLRTDKSDPGTQRLLKEAKEGVAQAKARAEETAKRVLALEERLAEAEHALREAAEARNDAIGRLSAVTVERDRMSGELMRVKAELEAAAVEHRAALSAARKAQTESAARTADLQTQLKAAQTERERLGGELDKAHVEAAAGVQGQQQLESLHGRLQTETQRADQLARELEEHRREAAASKVRLDRLSEDLREAEGERDRLSEDLSRRSDASSLRDAEDAGGRTRLQEALDRLREQLDRERDRTTDLQRRLDTARDEARTAAGRHAEASESYVEAVARADRLADDVAELRSRQATNLAEADRRVSAERDRIRSLETRLAEAEGRLNTATARQQGLERTIGDLTVERDRLGRDGEEARKAHAELDQRFATASADHERLKAETAKALQTRDATSSDLATTTARHSKAEADASNLRNQLAKAQAALEADRQAHAAALTAIRAQLANENARIAELSERLGQADRERTSAIARATDLEHRLEQASHERKALLAETEHLRADLAETAAHIRPGVEGAVAELRARLTAAETDTRIARAELDGTAKRAADRILDLESRLTAEESRATELESLREQLRLHAREREDARTALASATAARDQLTADLQRLREDLARARADDQLQTLEDSLAQAEGRIASERDRTSRLEVDVATARSQAQVALAGKEGLESHLSKVVADRERLLAEVDRLRAEVDQLRRQVRTTGPEQQAEISALKQLLTAERERVRTLEDRLAEAYRHQGETSGMTDGKLRDRLDRASTRIRHYREKLRDQRRKTETALEEVKEAKTEIEAYRASGIRPGVARSSPATVRQSLSSPSYPAQAAIGARGEFIHGRIDSSGNRPAVVVPVIPSATLRRPNAPSQAVVASSSRRTVRRSPLRWIVIGCLVSMILAIFAPAPLVVVSNAKISGEPAILTSPIPGRVSSITAELGREVLAGAVLMHIENPNPDRSALAALESQLASLEATILSLEAARNRRVETPVERSLRLYDAFLGRLGMGPAIEPTVKPSEATRATLEANRTALAEQIAIEKARIAEEAKAYLAAPRDGIVSNITTETVVTPGQRLVDLLPIQTDRITSPVKLREGDVVEVMLPDGSRARGRVAAPTGSTSTLATDDMVVELDRRLPGSWIGKKVDLIVLGRNPGTFTEVLAWWTRSFHL